MDDSFIKGVDPSELDYAGEFLSSWLPFLTRELCDQCSQTLTLRVRSLLPHPNPPDPDTTEPSLFSPSGPVSDPDPDSPDCDTAEPSLSGPSVLESDPNPHDHDTAESSLSGPVGSEWDPDPDPAPISPRVRMSWADMAQEEDELAESAEDPAKEGEEEKKVELSREQREWIRFNNVSRKKDFICLERIKGKITNVLEGLELHTGIFSAAEQKRIVDFVYKLQEKGRQGELEERTYSEPQKWMRGKGRVTMQFGCCYNYATDKNGNPPGILRGVASDPIPYLFKVIIRRLVSWHVLPPSCVPDSCIVNIYEPGDCIPPHIDSHDFVRPFSTVSFLSECNILFGSDLKIMGPGEFSGSTAIPLPVGSVLVLNGNGADVAKHCVPAVPTKRISITFRKMDEAKQPFGFIPEPDLQNLQPLQYDSVATKPQQQNINKQPERDNKSFKQGKRPKRRPSGENQHPSFEPQTPMIRPWQVIDARSATSSTSTRGRSRGYSTGRSFESKPRTDVRLLRDDGWSSPQREFANDEGSHSASSNSMTRRGGWDSTGRSAELKPRTDSQDFQLLRDRGRSSSQQEWVSDEGGQLEVGNGSGGRRVRVEQNRMIVSRNVDREEEEPMSALHRTSYRAYHPEVPVQSRNYGRRRGRVVIADD